MMRALKSFGAFWYDFVIGDDWQVAAIVVVALVSAGCIGWLRSRKAAVSVSAPESEVVGS